MAAHPHHDHLYLWLQPQHLRWFQSSDQPLVHVGYLHHLRSDVRLRWFRVDQTSVLNTAGVLSLRISYTFAKGILLPSDRSVLIVGRQGFPAFMEVFMSTVLVKASELSDLALDWAAAKAAGNGVHLLSIEDIQDWFPYSTEWEMAGPLIEYEKISLKYREGVSNYWVAEHAHAFRGSFYVDGRGPTPLIAAMRCYVASKLGDVVEVPSEVLPTVIKETT